MSHDIPRKTMNLSLKIPISKNMHRGASLTFQLGWEALVTAVACGPVERVTTTYE